MSTEGFDLVNDHIPGEHVHEYLFSYAQKFDLLKHMRFNSNIESAIDDGESGWTLVVNKPSEPTVTEKIKARKLIVATGLTSEPFLPRLEGREKFVAPVYHSSEFARAEKGLGAFKKVVVLGGAKSSWDIACTYASAGIEVDWIIRKSGHGPVWMMPSRITPFKIIPELLIQTRLITWTSPCIWGDVDGFVSIRKFLHQSSFGKKMVNAFFGQMAHGALARNDYDSHPETAKLKPWDDLFFTGTNRGLLNYDNDVFEFVRNGKIRVHVEDITHLSDHTVHLSNGEELSADVLICGTGWKDTPPINFVTDRELGLPGFTSPSIWKYIPRADAEIFEKCPKLEDQPEPRSYKPLSDDATGIINEPYRLYRFVVPPAFVQSRTLAFAGAYRSPATTIIAQAQALWITAFLDGQIPALFPPIDPQPPTTLDDLSPELSKTSQNEPANRIMYETVLHTQFGKWRYSRGFGSRFPELWFDCLPYVDMLLQDVGVKNRRKGSWWGECFTPYWPKDYLGIVGEYLKLKNARSETAAGENIDPETKYM
jgi:hypothetical protein